MGDYITIKTYRCLKFDTNNLFFWSVQKVLSTKYFLTDKIYSVVFYQNREYFRNINLDSGFGFS